MTQEEEETTARALKIDEEAERLRAENEHEAAYNQGLKASLGFFADDSHHQIDVLRRFFDDRIAEFDHGKVSKFDFILLDTIGYILSFDMTYAYTGVCTIDIDKETGRDILDVCGLSDEIDAVTDQKELKKQFEEYLLAGAALAKRIDSSTYPDWIELLTSLKFTEQPGSMAFKTIDDFNEFSQKLQAIVLQIWADNEVYLRNLKIQPRKPHAKARK